MSFSVAWDESSPAGTQDISLGDDRIREFKTQYRERFAVDHHAAAADDANTGYHEKTTLINQGSDPAQVASAIILYSKTVGGVRELYSRHESAALQQLTLNGKLWASAIGIAAQVTGDMLYFDGTIFNRLGIGSTGQLLGVVGGIPTWGGLPSGTVLQMQYSTDSSQQTFSNQVIPFDNTSPLWTEGGEYTQLAKAITPASASNILEIDVLVFAQDDFSANSMGNTTIMSVFTDIGGVQTLIGVGWAYYGSQVTNFAANTQQGTTVGPLRARIVMAAGSTNPITIKVRLGTSGASTTIKTNSDQNGNALFNGKLISSIIIKEIKA